MGNWRVNCQHFNVLKSNFRFVCEHQIKPAIPLFWTKTNINCRSTHYCGSHCRNVLWYHIAKIRSHQVPSVVVDTILVINPIGTFARTFRCIRVARWHNTVRRVARRLGDKPFGRQMFYVGLTTCRSLLRPLAVPLSPSDPRQVLHVSYPYRMYLSYRTCTSGQQKVWVFTSQRRWRSEARTATASLAESRV